MEVCVFCLRVGAGCGDLERCPMIIGRQPIKRSRRKPINLRGDWPQEQINITGQSADERMNWTLADIGRLFPTPRIELPPLVSSKS